MGYFSFDENDNLIDRQQFYRYTIDRNNGSYYRIWWGERKYANSTFDNIIRLNGTVMFEPFFASETPRNYVMSVPATYFCSGGCGGDRTDPDLIWYYNNGDCVSMETCKCKLKENKTEVGELLHCSTVVCVCYRCNAGYAGYNCEQILCNPQCKHGECTAPDVCSCEPQYVGDDCGSPVCTQSCVTDKGYCAAPDFCQCETGYYGFDCSGLCQCGEHGTCNSGQYSGV